ncbi:hypothetical protein LIER_37286 [Lithospermum erythrorhizon]|uniref:Uncharacterized protein n=1 Tax=Lithospermum erythrorhizon TaxID=34254 RepID=A0AAV3PJI0_LITER
MDKVKSLKIKINTQKPQDIEPLPTFELLSEDTNDRISKFTDAQNKKNDDNYEVRQNSLLIDDESEVEKEFWRLMRNAIVTLVANDPNDKLPLNYDQVFIRDFVSSGEIVKNFLLHIRQLQVSYSDLISLSIYVIWHVCILWLLDETYGMCYIGLKKRIYLRMYAELEFGK